MAAEKMSDTIESKAASWGDADYRTWVQSQIASKMLLKLGGFTVATAIALAGVGFAYVQSVQDHVQNTIRDNLRSEISNELREELEVQIARDVTLALSRQPELVRRIIDQAQDALESKISSLVREEGFVELTSDVIFQALQAQGGLQRILLEEARQRMFDPRSAEATRELGVRMFALFHPSVRIDGSAAPNPLRDTFNDVLAEIEAAEVPLPQLVNSILDQYPLGVYEDSGEAEHPCGIARSHCLDLDRQTVDIVLRLASQDTSYWMDYDALLSFFQRMPLSLVERSINWVADHPSNDMAEAALEGLMKSRHTESLVLTVSILAKRIADPNEELFYQRALFALHGLNPDAELPHEVRREALSSVWNTFSQEELNEVFANQAVQAQMRLGSLLLDDQDFLGERPRGLESYPSDDLIARRHIALSLLRPASTPSNMDEWEHTFRTSIARTMGRPALNALAIRLHRDGMRSLPVERVADAMMAFAVGSNQVNSDFAAVAFSHASQPAFLNATEDYFDLWQNDRPATTSESYARAIFARRLNREAGLEWMGRQFSSIREPGDGFELHLANGIAVMHGGRTGRTWESVLRTALQALSQTPESERTGLIHGLHAMLLERVVLFAQDNRWEAAGVLEDSGALLSGWDDGGDAGAVIEQLRASHHWIGTPPTADLPQVSLRNGARERLVFTDAMSPEGRWFGITVSQNLPFRVSGNVDGEFVLFDSARERAVSRHTVSDPRLAASLSLASGDYLVHWRAADQSIGDLTFEMDAMVTPNARETPHSLTAGQVRFFSGQEAGTGWFSIDLDAGQQLIIETTAAPDSDEPPGSASDRDTEIWLYGPNGSPEPLAYDDDGAEEAFYSRLDHHVASSGTYLVNVTRYGQDAFPPRTAFDINVDIQQ